MNKSKISEGVYDVAIIGAGPCGVTAAIYLTRAGKKVCVFEKAVIGGQVAQTKHIQNYPGFLEVDGAILAQNFSSQLTDNNVEIIYDEVIKIEVDKTNATNNINLKKIYTKNCTLKAKAIILSIGAGSRKLGLQNEERFIGSGVSYCATCDGRLYKGLTVAVYGGGNSALEDVLYLSDIASKVYLIHRRDSFRAEPTLIQQMQDKITKEHKNIELCLSNVITNLAGDDYLEGVTIKNVLTGEEKFLPVDGLFVAIGRTPNTEFLDGLLNLDENNYIIVNNEFQSSISGIFAGGDVITKELRQIVTATSDGANISVFVNKYLNQNKE